MTTNNERLELHFRAETEELLAAARQPSQQLIEETQASLDRAARKRETAALDYLARMNGGNGGYERAARPVQAPVAMFCGEIAVS